MANIKRLYKVTITKYVMAENEDAALILVDCYSDEGEAVLAKNVDAEWFDAFPFGADDDRTCGEIIKNGGI